MINPETCWHYILYAGITKELTVYVRCVSCDTNLTGVIEHLRDYEYDINNNLWVHVPKSKRTLS
jgi:hypothetical protein